MRFLIVCAFLTTVLAHSEDYSYAIVSSKNTATDKDWIKVINVLKNRYNGKVVVYMNSIDESVYQLSKIMPRYTAFVAKPDEATREFVAKIHQLTRSLDDDPYGDTIWGIVTGFNAQNAYNIVSVNKPVIIRRAVAGTSIPLDFFSEGVWYSEGKPGFGMAKDKDGSPHSIKTPIDTTKLFVDELNGNADMFITSGHATERDWQIGYSYKNGALKSQNGSLYGVDTAGNKFQIKSAHPRVYLPVGNCLMGHIDNSNAMALAFLNSASVVQMIGYTVPTWFGFMGWGILDYFVEQPGRFTLSEAFFANQQALIWQLQKNPTSKGHLFDRDVVAFYGDPAFESRIEPIPSGWEQTLVRTNDTFIFNIKLLKGQKSFDLMDANGSQRGKRPIFQLLPIKIGKYKLLEGEEYQPVITENFILIPQPEKIEKTEFRIVIKTI